MIQLDGLQRLRLQQDCVRLSELGPRVLTEYLTEVAATIGGAPVMRRLLSEYVEQLRPELLAVMGGDKLVAFPFVEVPR